MKRNRKAQTRPRRAPSGRATAHARALAGLLALKAAPVVPAMVVAAVSKREPLDRDVEVLIDTMLEEAARVSDARRALLDVPSTAPLQGSIL